MIPTDIGLPPRFTAFRRGQFETACEVASSLKRFIIHSMPTGSGKSIMYMAVHRLLDLAGSCRTLVVTANKGLQEQLLNDFGAIGLIDIRGQANYECVKLMESRKKTGGRVGCDIGPCHFGQFCKLHPRYPEYEAGCHFYDQLVRIRKSKLVVTNYDFWMSANRYMDPGILGKFDLLILDEAHDAPDKLSEFCSVKISADECAEILQTTLPPVEDGAESWVDWAIQHGQNLKAEIERGKMFGLDTEIIKRMQDLAGKLEFLGTAQIWSRSEPSSPGVSIPGQVNDWVGEKTAEDGRVTGVVFSPVWAHAYAERFLFGGVKKVLMVSATILPQTAHYLGIEPEEMDYNEHTSDFHPDLRPIWLLPTANLNFNSSDSEYRAISVKVDQFLGSRSDRRGLIQVPSYDLAYRLRMASQFKGRIRYHKKDRSGPLSVASVVQEFKRSHPGTVLISPVLYQGYDFPYEQCEFQIIPKMPFVPTTSAVMKARVKSDKKYLNYLVALRLIQMLGRGMRALDDRCETLILDGNVNWFLAAARKQGFIPKYISAAIRYVDSIPQPPPKLPARAAAL